MNYRLKEKISLSTLVILCIGLPIQIMSGLMNELSIKEFISVVVEGFGESEFWGLVVFPILSVPIITYICYGNYQRSKSLNIVLYIPILVLSLGIAFWGVDIVGVFIFLALVWSLIVANRNVQKYS